MRDARNIAAGLLLAASLAGCAYNTGSDGQRSTAGRLDYGDSYGTSGGYGINGGFAGSGGHAADDEQGYDSGMFGSGYDYSGGIAGMHHYYGY